MKRQGFIKKQGHSVTCLWQVLATLIRFHTPMWSHLPLRGMMTTMFGGCKANIILMPFSHSMQVGLTNGHCEATFASIKLLFYWLVLTLQRRISLSIVACIIELAVVVWNPCLLIWHTYNWMTVRLMMRIATKIQLMRSTLSTLGGLWPWKWIIVLTMLMCRKVHLAPWIEP